MHVNSIVQINWNADADDGRRSKTSDFAFGILLNIIVLVAVVVVVVGLRFADVRPEARAIASVVADDRRHWRVQAVVALERSDRTAAYYIGIGKQIKSEET